MGGGVEATQTNHCVGLIRYQALRQAVMDHRLDCDERRTRTKNREYKNARQPARADWRQAHQRVEALVISPKQPPMVGVTAAQPRSRQKERQGGINNRLYTFLSCMSVPRAKNADVGDDRRTARRRTAGSLEINKQECWPSSHFEAFCVF